MLEPVFAVTEHVGSKSERVQGLQKVFCLLRSSALQNKGSKPPDPVFQKKRWQHVTLWLSDWKHEEAHQNLFRSFKAPFCLKHDSPPPLLFRILALSRPGRLRHSRAVCFLIPLYEPYGVRSPSSRPLGANNRSTGVEWSHETPKYSHRKRDLHSD